MYGGRQVLESLDELTSKAGLTKRKVKTSLSVILLGTGNICLECGDVDLKGAQYGHLAQFTKHKNNPTMSKL